MKPQAQFIMANNTMSESAKSVEQLTLELEIERLKVLKLKNELKRSNEEMESKSKEVISGFSYASRIVDAMLPGTKALQEIVADSFIIHQPKELIGGDFYFFTEVENGYVIASADCTGHGIPGALISMIGYHLLKDIIVTKKITRPGQILNRLDDCIRKSLHKSERINSLRDGMDISICLVNTEKNILEFAGANQSLYFFMKGRMVEFKSNKFTIGEEACDYNHSYINHTIEFEKGDRFYMSSDGFHDQFGGAEEKRLMKKNFTGLLKLANDLPINEQRDFMYQKFNEWKGDFEQTDDVLLIGVEL